MPYQTEIAKPANRLARRLLAIVSLSVVLTACATTSPDTPSASRPASTGPGASAISETLKRGNEALRAGEFELADNLYRHALTKEPDSVQARLGLAEVALASGRLDFALQAFRAIALTENVPSQALQGEGLVLLLKGRAAEAEIRLQSAVERDPNLWRAWNALGRIVDRKSDWTASNECYRKALEIMPGAVSVHNNYGFSLLLQGRSKKAYEVLRQAAELDPSLTITRNNLRLALAAQGRYAEALADVDPDQKSAALNNVGFIAMARRDYDSAELFLREAIEGDPSYYRKATRNLEKLRAMK